MRRSEMLIIRYRRTRVVESSPQRESAQVITAETYSVSSNDPNDSKVAVKSNRALELITASKRPSVWVGLLSRLFNR
jgi:hypothetical protein